MGFRKLSTPREVNADGGMYRWKQGETDEGVKMGGRRDGRVRLRGGEGIWKMDGLLLSIRETESEGRDGGKKRGESV